MERPGSPRGHPADRVDTRLIAQRTDPWRGDPTHRAETRLTAQRLGSSRGHPAYRANTRVIVWTWGDLVDTRLFGFIPGSSHRYQTHRVATRFIRTRGEDRDGRSRHRPALRPR